MSELKKSFGKSNKPLDDLLAKSRHRKDTAKLTAAIMCLITALVVRGCDSTSEITDSPAATTPLVFDLVK